jgi:hypothetical protein
MAVPLAVRPVAPSGAQYAPGWTIRAGGVVRVGAGARVRVVVGRWVALRVDARGGGGDVTRVGALVVGAAVVGAVVDVALSLVAGVEGAAHPPRRGRGGPAQRGRQRDASGECRRRFPRSAYTGGAGGPR